MAIGLFGILGGLSGMVVERRGLPFAFKLCVILLSAASVVLAFAPAIWMLPFISAALFGLSYIAITGILLVWGITIFIKNASLGIGLPFLLLAAGQILGSLLGGITIEYIGYSFTFLAFGLFGVLSLLCSPQRDPIIRKPRDYDFKSD